jgi:hypothetical protein
MDDDKEDKIFPNGPWILFPEVIGIAIIAIFTPYALFQMYISGKVLFSIIGFIVWSISLIYTVILIKKERYFLARLPMTGILAAGFLINYTTQLT